MSSGQSGGRNSSIEVPCSQMQQVDDHDESPWKPPTTSLPPSEAQGFQSGEQSLQKYSPSSSPEPQLDFSLSVHLACSLQKEDSPATLWNLQYAYHSFVILTLPFLLYLTRSTW